MEGSPGDGAEPAIPASPPPRQRWRLVLARSAGATRSTGRELAEAWDAAIDAAGLPVHRPAGKSRARLAFGAPVPAVIALEHELADLVLAEFVAAWHVREAVGAAVPDGWRLIDLYDVWLGEPPLAGQVAAADYRIELEGGEPAAVDAAARGLLSAASLPRDRARGGDVVRYDLRPLLVDVRLAAAVPPLVIRTRTRFHPTLGTGRPEEVIAALGDAVGRELTPRSIVRERVLLADNLDLSAPLSR